MPPLIAWKSLEILGVVLGKISTVLMTQREAPTGGAALPFHRRRQTRPWWPSQRDLAGQGLHRAGRDAGHTEMMAVLDIRKHPTTVSP